jgi:polyisoprenoid-binding protein YceI
MNTLCRWCIGLAISLSCGTIAPAATWKLDAAHSSVRFGVSHLVISEVTGSFGEFDATMESDRPDFTDARITATIKASSIDTENEKRDNHLRSDDFFNAEKFPEIRFNSTSIEKSGDSIYLITGELSIRDSIRIVVLNTHYRGSVVDPWWNTKAVFKATTIINRFDFGLRWNAAMETGGLVAGENVEITLILEFTKQQ